MEWLGAMFKGIGDTFTAGKDANVAQINERMHRADLLNEAQQRYYQDDADELNYLFGTSKQDNNLIMVVLVACITLVIVLIIFRKKKP